MATDVMYYVGVGEDDHLWDTAMTYSGAWLGSFEQPVGSNGAPGFVNMDVAGVGNGGLELVAIGKDGKLWHTLRDNNGNWQNAINPIAGQVSGGPPSFTWVGTAGDGQGGLNVVAVGSDGKLYHTARANNGSWSSPFDAVGAHSSGGPSAYTAVAAAGSGGPTQIVAVGNDGRLWHTIRNPNNSWQATMGDVRSQSAGGPGAFTAIALSGDSQGGLNVVAMGNDGQLWHTSRASNGKWDSQFQTVASLSQGMPTSGINCFGAGNDTRDNMEVIVGLETGKLLHTLRLGSGGTWQGTGQILTTGGPAGFLAIAAGSGEYPSGGGIGWVS